MMANFRISYAELADIIFESNRDIDQCLDVLKRRYPNLTEKLQEKIEKELRKTFLPRFNTKWQAVSRKRDRFFATYEDWLSNMFTIPESDMQPIEEKDVPGPSKRGRPEKTFEECCERTKRNRVKSMCESLPEDMIIQAANKLQRFIRKHFVYP